MRKFSVTLAAAALVLTSMAFAAGAQTQQPGAASFHAMLRNATPIEQVACRRLGGACPLGWVRACNPVRCWCRPC
jgi:hypothetical protein